LYPIPISRIGSLHRNISVKRMILLKANNKTMFAYSMFILFVFFIVHILRCSFHIFDFLIDKFAIRLYVIRFVKMYIFHFQHINYFDLDDMIVFSDYMKLILSLKMADIYCFLISRLLCNLKF